MHYAPTLAAARRGIHVFCEKPMARSLVQADEMVRVCADHLGGMGNNHAVAVQAEDNCELVGAAEVDSARAKTWSARFGIDVIFDDYEAMLFAIDHFGVGLEGKRYITAPYVVPLFERTGEALVGLLSLSYVPGLFDILPMYLVILAMVPFVAVARNIPM